MPPTSQIFDLARFAQSVTSAGGVVPDSLGHLLRGHELLTAPRATEDPANLILDAAVDGSLTAAKLDKLLPAAALAATANEFRAELASRAERMLVQRWYRTLEKDGAADQILDSMRPKFNEHAEQIAHAKAVGVNSESTLEHLIATGGDGLVEAWNALSGHIRAITRIAAVASEFGCRPGAMFPQVKVFTLGDTHLIDDRALMTTCGGLIGDSAMFMRPDAGHRTSPFFRTGLRLHTIAEAQSRHDLWAASEHDRLYRDRPRGGHIDEGGVVVYHEPPKNPFRREEAHA